MVNKEKLLLLAAIYTLLPGAAPDAMAETGESERAKNKRSAAFEKVQPGSTSRSTPKTRPTKTQD